MIPSKVLPNIYIQLHSQYELLFTVKLYFSFILLYTACFSLDLSLFIRFIAYLKSVKYFPYQQKEEMKSQAINNVLSSIQQVTLLGHGSKFLHLHVTDRIEILVCW